MGQQEEVPAAATGTDGFEGMADLERMAEQLGANGGMPDMAKIMEMMAGGDLISIIFAMSGIPPWRRLWR